MWPFKKPEPQAYEVQTTRLFNKKVAPKGWTFLIVKYKSMEGSYQSYGLFEVKDLTDGRKKDLCKALFSQLKKKYGI